MALTEEYHYGADGRMQNSSYLDYRMPTALDLPMIETVLVEVPNPGHPYGVRGVGEVLHRPAAGRRPGRHRRGDGRAVQQPADPAAGRYRRAVRRLNAPAGAASTAQSGKLGQPTSPIVFA